MLLAAAQIAVLVNAEVGESLSPHCLSPLALLERRVHVMVPASVLINLQVGGRGYLKAAFCPLSLAHLV